MLFFLPLLVSDCFELVSNADKSPAQIKYIELTPLPLCQGTGRCKLIDTIAESDPTCTIGAHVPVTPEVVVVREGLVQQPKEK